MKNYYGQNKEKKYFEGWYLKHQNSKDTIAFIIGVQKDLNGQKSSFVQAIINNEVYHYIFSYDDFFADDNTFYIKLDGLIINEKGIKIDLKNEKSIISGFFEYDEFTLLKYDIMGPFTILPFMECRHQIVSMNHTINGKINVKLRKSYDGQIIYEEKEYIFKDGKGYIEKDMGKSFPEYYMWTQCNNFAASDLAIMVANAKIPYLKMSFSGTICSIYYNNNHYRLATYFGGSCKKLSSNKYLIKQNKYRLYIEHLSEDAVLLYAPDNGEMSRIVYESLACDVNYKFYIGKDLIFDVISNRASFEISQKQSN